MNTRAKARAQQQAHSEAQTPSQPQQQSGNGRPSPDWDICSDNFSVPEPSKSPSPLIPPISSIPEASDDDEEDQSAPGPDIVSSSQVQNARSARWLPWQDRTLIQEVDKHRPFRAARGDSTRDAWDGLAVELLKDSTINGKAINRTGSACRARFVKLLKAHQADQTRSLQKTGTDEEVNAHIELMTQVAELMHARELEKDEKSVAARKKGDIEARAAQELRDSAMKGLVRREALTDVAALEGASVREKQGQRKRYRESDSDKENNLVVVESKPKRRRHQLTEIVKTRNAADAKRLEQARKTDQDRHAETIGLQRQSLALQENMVAGLGQLAQGVAALADAQARLMNMETQRSDTDARLRYEDSERRRVDAERRAAEAERHATLLSAISRKD